MRFHLVDVVQASPQETFDWWTDLGEDDAGRIMPPLRSRRIIRRAPAETETEDRWSVFGLPIRTRAILRPMPPQGWTVTSYFRGGSYRDEVRIEPVPGGTRVTMEINMDGLRWPWSWACRALRPFLARLFHADLRAVNRALEATLAQRERIALALEEGPMEPAESARPR